MAVTSVDVDVETLRLAKAALGVSTTRDAINLALSDVVRRQRQLEAIELLATLDLDPDARLA